MNRKKITKAALSGLVAVTMVPAMAAPLVANAEGNDATAETTNKQVTVTVDFVLESGQMVKQVDVTLNADTYDDYSVLAASVPQGYEMVTKGQQWTAVEDGALTVVVKKVATTTPTPDVDRMITISYFTADGNMVTSKEVAFKDLNVEKVDEGNISLSEIPALQGYNIVAARKGMIGDFNITGDILNQWEAYSTIDVLVEKEAVNTVQMNVRFVDRAGGFIGGGDYFLPEGVQKRTILEEYLPEGYQLAENGDFMVVEGGSVDITVESIYDGTTLNFAFVDANGNEVGGGDVIVDTDKDGIFSWSEIAEIIPEGYKLELGGDAFVADYIGGNNTITVSKIYNSTIVNVQFIDENGTVVGGGDYFVDEDGDGIFNASELELPVGYKLNGGGDYFVTDTDINIPVTKINKGTIINVVFKDPQGNNLGGGDYLVDVDGDGIANYSELDLPVGYKLNVTGDFFVEEGGHYTVVLNRDGAAIIHVVFKSEGGKNLGGGDYFVDEDGDGIFNYSELTLPEGYELIVTGDEFVDTEKTYEIVLNKEIEGTIINVVYVDQEGNNLGGGDFFVDPDDDGIANYSELDLPEGYELSVTGDFFVTPGKSYTITLHKITEEETAAATLVVRYVDQENGNEVVLEKTYNDQVGPVGETATYIEDVVVPEGYELVQDIEGIAADVEYGQTKVMYVFVTKTAQEPTQPGDEEEPNTPAEGTEESEQTDGTNTGVAMSLAGVFGTMSAALAGMVALLRRKQK
ncbi:hypothetical protein [Faecalicoccus pleomorphus]|uniref:hypothetical protein n=1 Tax=Faecalicoccus pleomorphus TaxID=1323 RepID=UPI0039F536E3